MDKNLFAVRLSQFILKKGIVLYTATRSDTLFLDPTILSDIVGDAPRHFQRFPKERIKYFQMLTKNSLS